MKGLYFVVLLLIALAVTGYASVAYAEGPIYQPGDEIPIDCDNAETRTDGSPLAPSEISSVVVYISDIADKALLPPDPADFTPQHIEIMEGGCTPRQVSAGNLTPGTQYYKYGVTYDTGDPSNNVAERVSDYTEPSAPFYTDLAKPNAPVVR